PNKNIVYLPCENQCKSNHYRNTKSPSRCGWDFCFAMVSLQNTSPNSVCWPCNCSLSCWATNGAFLKISFKTKKHLSFCFNTLGHYWHYCFNDAYFLSRNCGARQAYFQNRF